MNNSEEYGSKKLPSRDSIIGLGEDSFRKNYYPELQQKIHDLEMINSQNTAIISASPDLLLWCNCDGEMTPFAYANKDDEWLMRKLLEDHSTVTYFKSTALSLKNNHEFLRENLTLEIDQKTYYFDARFQHSDNAGVLINVRNITPYREMLLELKHHAERDSLTTLYNRHMFDETMATMREESAEKVAFIAIDINGLKFINDTLGHQNGDLAIVESARLIHSTFSAYGETYRTGGDEFTIITKGVDEPFVSRLLLQLTENIEATAEYQGLSKVSLSYGYSFHRSGSLNPDYLYQTADNNMLQNKLLKKESTRGTFVKAFMKALEAKDYISEGHADRMETLALYIGKHLNLHQDQLDRIILLTKFHDIGKIGIPDSILKKPASLTPDEWNVMRSHTAIGERIALESNEIHDIAPLILHHHERWDGKGYPDGLKAEDIPIEDRILCIVDSFDAMTNDRPYHKAMSIEDAVEEVLNCSGLQFDPEIVEAFYKTYEKVTSTHPSP